MSDLKQLRVLAVDDSSTVLKLHEAYLKKCGVQTVLTATHGKQALQMMTDQAQAGTPIGLLISDIVMPEMDGTELVEKVRSRPEWKDLPIVLISADVDPDRIAHAKKNGVKGYLQKPFTEDQIRNVLEIIHSSQPIDPAQAELLYPQIETKDSNTAPPSSPVGVGSLDWGPPLAEACHKVFTGDQFRRLEIGEILFFKDQVRPVFSDQTAEIHLDVSGYRIRVLLSMPETVVIRQFLDTNEQFMMQVTDGARDAMKELCNVVLGHLKGFLTRMTGIKAPGAVPSWVSQTDEIATVPIRRTWVLPMECEYGLFTLELRETSSA